MAVAVSVMPGFTWEMTRFIPSSSRRSGGVRIDNLGDSYLEQDLYGSQARIGDGTYERSGPQVKLKSYLKFGL